jgi:hypothetical protein
MARVENEDGSVGQKGDLPVLSLFCDDEALENQYAM